MVITPSNGVIWYWQQHGFLESVSAKVFLMQHRPLMVRHCMTCYTRSLFTTVMVAVHAM